MVITKKYEGVIISDGGGLSGINLIDPLLFDTQDLTYS